MRTKSRIGKLCTGLSGALLASLLAAASWLVPVQAQADGCFVMPPFVWNKYKDINEPTQKAILVHDGQREDLLLQVKYDGPVSDFGWLIPVPSLPTVQQGSMECFYELSRLTQEHWDWPMTHGESKALSASAAAAAPPVTVIKIETVGAYEIAVLSARDAGSLKAWLDKHQFSLPKDKAHVIDSYVQQHWYFIAVKIHLPDNRDQPHGRGASVGRQLARGELHPLHISFASPQCVFPLKISSLNGRPSEVQLYVLAHQQLLEMGMFEKEFEAGHRAAAAERAKLEAQERALDAGWRARARGAGARSASESADIGAFDPPPKPAPHRWVADLGVGYAEPFPYLKVSKKELPHTAKELPSLRTGSWWLTKKTWTFQPADMRDLRFEPALPALAGKLASTNGYELACYMMNFGPEATSVLLEALAVSDPHARIAAAAALTRDLDGLAAVAEHLNDPEAEVRLYAAQAAQRDWEPKRIQPLIGLLSDPDQDVRREAAAALAAYPEEVCRHAPTLLKLLKEGQPGSRFAAFLVLARLDVALPREEVVRFFSVPEREVVVGAYGYLRPKDLSCDEAAPLLQNPLMFSRLLGLGFLHQVPSRRAVELALPLLRDKEKPVRAAAHRLLCELTAQKFPQAQPDQWDQWWAAHKATFTPQVER